MLSRGQVGTPRTAAVSLLVAAIGLEGCGTLGGFLFREEEYRTTTVPLRISATGDPARLHLLGDGPATPLTDRTPWEGELRYTEERLSPVRVFGGFAGGFAMSVASIAGWAAYSSDGTFSTETRERGFVVAASIVAVDLLAAGLWAATTDFSWKRKRNRKKVAAVSSSGVVARAWISPATGSELVIPLREAVKDGKRALEARAANRGVWWVKKSGFELALLVEGDAYPEVTKQLGSRAGWGRVPGIYLCAPYSVSQARSLQTCTATASVNACRGHLLKEGPVFIGRAGSLRSGCDPTQSHSALAMEVDDLRIDFVAGRVARVSVPSSRIADDFSVALAEGRDTLPVQELK